MTETLQVDSLQAKLSEVEAQFKEAREKKEFFREKSSEAETLEHQLVGQYKLLQELITSASPDDGPEANGNLLEAATE